MAETCAGSLVCPADAVKAEGDPCDDGDPETGTSSCTAQECHGVTTTVDVPPEVVVPPDQSPGKVTIPIAIEIPGSAGSSRAQVVLQGFVDCLDLPSPPKQCRGSGQTAGAYSVRLESVFLRVTPRVERSLGRTQNRSLRVGLPLNKLGRKLFARLRPDEASRTLPVQVASTLRDRRGRSINAVFESLLARRR